VLGPLYARNGINVPVVTTNHGLFDEESRALFRAIAPHVAIIAISQAQARTAAGIPIAAVIPHGLEVARFPFDARGGDYWLFLGRMSPYKGPHRAARVARAAGQQLVIAAKMHAPEEHNYFEQHVRPLLDHRISYVGEVGGQEKLDLLAGARGLLNPIRWPEPFGLVMIEALACGTPVLSFTSGAAPEIVRHRVNGFLCRDEADMLRRMDDVDDIDRRACRGSVEESFSAERMVGDHLALYERVLGNEHASSSMAATYAVR
jgi:glycosyltransferase involved in cell wall biosynthesis